MKIFARIVRCMVAIVWFVTAMAIFGAFILFVVMLCSVHWIAGVGAALALISVMGAPIVMWADEVIGRESK